MHPHDGKRTRYIDTPLGTVTLRETKWNEGEEDEAEDNVLVFGRLYSSAQLVGGVPKGLFKTLLLLRCGFFLGHEVPGPSTLN